MEKHATLLANNSQQCLGVAASLSTWLKLNLNSTAILARTWPQQCWRMCANGSNTVALASANHGTKEMLDGSKVRPVSKTLRNDSQQHATKVTPKGVQTEATCNIQKCWELFANNVASNCKELFIKRFVIYQCLLRLCWDLFETFHFQFREMVLGLSLGSGIIKTERH